MATSSSPLLNIVFYVLMLSPIVLIGLFIYLHATRKKYTITGKTHYLNEHTGWKAWLLTLDHKRIGLMYLGFVVFSFALGGMFAVALRFELLTPTQLIFSAKEYNQLFTLHGAVMVFLFIIPAIPAALGNFVLPLQLGAKDVAFPKLNLASFYIYVLGALFCIASLYLGAIDTGWTFYTPYSTDSNTSVIAITTGALY